VGGLRYLPGQAGYQGRLMATFPVGAAKRFQVERCL
jgi:hypothetical protein